MPCNGVRGRLEEVAGGRLGMRWQEERCEGGLLRVFLLNIPSLDSSLFLRPTTAQVAATAALAEKDFFFFG